jgi:hypothetical protein
VLQRQAAQLAEELDRLEEQGVTPQELR